MQHQSPTRWRHYCAVDSYTMVDICLAMHGLEGPSHTSGIPPRPTWVRIAATHGKSGVPLFASHRRGIFRAFSCNAMGSPSRYEADVQLCGAHWDAQDRIVKDHGSCQPQLPADCAMMVGAPSGCPHYYSLLTWFWKPPYQWYTRASQLNHLNAP